MVEFTYDTFKKSYNVVMEMLNDRGFRLNKITHKEFEIQMKEEFPQIKTTAIRMSKNQRFSENSKNFLKTTTILIVWFPHNIQPSKITLQTISELKESRNNDELKKIIIITDLLITHKASKIIEVEKSFFEVRSFIETQYNPTKHRLVPNHRAVLEKEPILKTYGTIEKFPKILTSDPICRWYMWKPGTLVEISRKGEFNESLTISYRVVVIGR